MFAGGKKVLACVPVEPACSRWPDMPVEKLQVVCKTGDTVTRAETEARKAAQEMRDIAKKFGCNWIPVFWGF